MSQKFKPGEVINHEYHLNLTQRSEDVKIEHVLENMTLFEPSTSIATPDMATNSKRKRYIAQLMIKTNGNGKKEPVLAIEYKPPHT